MIRVDYEEYRKFGEPQGLTFEEWASDGDDVVAEATK